LHCLADHVGPDPLNHGVYSTPRQKRLVPPRESMQHAVCEMQVEYELGVVT
jgi:hypothetical protein